MIPGKRLAHRGETPVQDRSRLGFVEAVRSAFAFLVEAFGFVMVHAEPTLVRYEAPRVFVNVYHGRSSYELVFQVALRPHRSWQLAERFTLEEILEAGGVRKDLDYTFLQASTPERVAQLVPYMAELVQRYAGPALQGDRATFSRLREAQSAISQAFHKQYRLSRVREQADEAWRQKWYPLVVKLYESMADDLARHEAARLAYARKHSGQQEVDPETYQRGAIDRP